ncbi:MAG TPA: hypothetical protein PLY90_01680 [Candidatus Hydrogenedentes bacterium]|jgi:hypothetical protein|nr:MAG: hypothetical protein BWY07_00375 [Candidatus Hydrogenedentes bacterium ADurb.Bin170]HNZ47349.1 hypothetical protein [Candidatus Hydrogenedentota bacterium]HOD94082.1 hypothetical protein [Candidatus Hydrogenedentota bacterium]HOM46909.1 hypothetical protein [Candidatus Hydrogenedentota bacterium]HOR49490.1 hypothetical protein [Candidatus Hydrogenedentota bacterium]
MNEQNKKQIIMAAVLGVVLIGVLVYQFGLSGSSSGGRSADTKTAEKSKTTSKKSSSNAKGAPVADAAALASIDIAALIATVEVVPFDYALSRTARDPMAPLVGNLPPGLAAESAAADETDALAYVQRGTTATRVVSGIIWDKQFPVAIVDDIVVHVGYEFPNGAVVHSIEPLRVLFKVGEAIIPVEMKEF